MTAKIDSLVTDQGNGSSWCSACNHKLDLEEVFKTMVCPNCHEPLEWGNVGGDFGGHDF